MKDFQQLGFLNLVDYLTRTSSTAIENLRLITHRDDFTFKEVLPEETQEGGEELVAIVQKIVSPYLHQTEAEMVLGLPDDFRKPTDPIERNTSWFVHTVDTWREYYQRKEAIDRELEESSPALRKEGIEDCLQSRDWTNSWRLNQLRREKYQKAGLSEDPVFLAELCFSAAIQIKGWDKLKDEELFSALKKEKVPLGEFEEISGRKIMLYLSNPDEWDSSFGLTGEGRRRFNLTFSAFVNHQDFPLIYNQALTIEEIPDRWAFILRRAYEIGEEKEIFIGATAQQYSVLFQKKLEEYGLIFLCPYFRPDPGSITRESCLIDCKPSEGGEEEKEEAISTTCSGKAYQCRIYSNRCSKIPFGESNLPQRTETIPTKFRIPKMEVAPVDLDDLRDWWEGEGIYE